MLSPSSLSVSITPIFLISTLEAFFTLIPYPYKVASSPIPSNVIPQFILLSDPLPLITISPPSSVEGSVTLPIILTTRGLYSYPFLYKSKIFCNPLAFSTLPLELVCTSNETVFFVSSVTYIILALSFIVPSRLYAPVVAPFTHAKPVLSCASTVIFSDSTWLAVSSFPSTIGTTLNL